MHILHVTHNFPRRTGDPSGHFLLALAREQVALGHSVTVLAPHAPDAPERESMDGVQVVRFRYGRDEQETLAYTGAMHELVRRSWAARWRLALFVRAMRAAARRLAGELPASVVHVHWWFPGGLAAWPGRPLGTVPVVVTSHGTDLFMLRKLPVLAPMARAVLRAADAVSTVSRALAKEVGRLGLDESRVTVLPMPLDLATIGAEAAPFEERDEDHLLFVGRLSAQKGAADLLRALAIVARHRPSAHLTIAGDGAEHHGLVALAAELGVRERVSFRGTLSPALVAALYARASVLAVPSTVGPRGETEGFGLVAAEAMLAGLPVVATRSGGLTDIVADGDTGLLVPPGDPAALAAALERALADRELARTIAARARVQVLERFTPRVIADGYCALYARLVTGGAPAVRPVLYS